MLYLFRINYPYIEFSMFSTIFSHVVIENSIRPVKIILYCFNRDPLGRNGVLRSSPVYGYKAQLEEAQKAPKSKNKTATPSGDRNQTEDVNKNHKRTLNVCIERRTNVGCRVSMDT